MLRAATLMRIGVAASLIGVPVYIVTLNVAATDYARANAGTSGVTGDEDPFGWVAILGVLIVGVAAAALWGVLARACEGGRPWARITGAVFFAIDTASLFIPYLQGVTIYGRLYAVVIWVIGLAVTILLWQPAVSEFYRDERRRGYTKSDVPRLLSIRS